MNETISQREKPLVFEQGAGGFAAVAIAVGLCALFLLMPGIVLYNLVEPAWLARSILLLSALLCLFCILFWPLATSYAVDDKTRGLKIETRTLRGHRSRQVPPSMISSIEIQKRQEREHDRSSVGISLGGRHLGGADGGQGGRIFDVYDVSVVGQRRWTLACFESRQDAEALAGEVARRLGGKPVKRIGDLLGW